MTPVLLSMQVGLLATILALPIALGLGFWLARTRSRWRPVVTTLIFLPLVLPPVVTGWMLLVVFGRHGWLGRWLAAVGWPVPFTPTAAVIAAVVVGLPLFVMSTKGAFESVDRRLEELSWTCGVPPGQTTIRLTLPLAAPGILAGAVMAFARALGEFGATIVLAGNTEDTRTIAVAVYALLDDPHGAKDIGALVAASVAMSAAALLAYDRLTQWQRRRLELSDG